MVQRLARPAGRGRRGRHVRRDRSGRLVLAVGPAGRDRRPDRHRVPDARPAGGRRRSRRSTPPWRRDGLAIAWNVGPRWERDRVHRGRPHGGRRDRPASATCARSELEGVGPIRVETRLDEILPAVQRALVANRSMMVIPVLQLALLATYTLLLAARLLLEHRRSELALLRARGASTRQIVRLTLLEAALLVLPGAAARADPRAARAPRRRRARAVRGARATRSGSPACRGGQSRSGRRCCAGWRSCVPTLGRAKTYVESQAERGRQNRRTVVQRAGGDLLLLGGAAIAYWQLRHYESPVVASGGRLTVDPLLVLGPCLVLFAAGLVALRVAAVRRAGRADVRGRPADARRRARRVAGRAPAAALLRPGAAARVRARDRRHVDGVRRVLGAVAAGPGDVPGRCGRARRRTVRGRRRPDVRPGRRAGGGRRGRARWPPSGVAARGSATRRSTCWRSTPSALRRWSACATTSARRCPALMSRACRPSDPIRSPCRCPGRRPSSAFTLSGALTPDREVPALPVGRQPGVCAHPARRRRRVVVTTTGHSASPLDGSSVDRRPRSTCRRWPTATPRPAARCRTRSRSSAPRSTCRW